LVALSDLMFYGLRSFQALLVANFLGGVGAAMTSASRSALLADKTRGASRRWAFTASFAFFSMGSVVGSFLAGLPDLLQGLYGLPSTEATRPLFALCAAFALTSFLLVLPVREEPLTPRARPRVLTIRSWDVVAPYCVSQALLGSGAGLILPWFSYYFLVKFGVKLSEVGVLFAVTQALMALGYVSASKLASRLGSVRTAVACQVISVGALLAIPFSPGFALASVFYVVRAVLMNMATPVLRAFYMGLLRREERASGSALQNTTFWSSRSLGTYGSGFLMEIASLDAPFFACSALYLAAFLALYMAFGRAGEGRRFTSL